MSRQHQTLLTCDWCGAEDLRTDDWPAAWVALELTHPTQLIEGWPTRAASHLDFCDPACAGLWFTRAEKAICDRPVQP